MPKFTIIQTIGDNGLNVEFEHVKAKSAKKALQQCLTDDAEANLGMVTVIAIVPGWVEKALEDADIEEVIEDSNSW